MSLFLTGTDTGVGKTYTAVQLLRLLRAAGVRCAGMKPICCGDRADAEMLLAASSEGLTIEEVNPVWLKTPTAPWTAALREDTPIATGPLLEGLADLERRFDFVLVEGVGGWLVPIAQDYFVSDLAAAMKLEVVIVALNRLGCLNHTLLTVESVTARGMTCRAVALNSTADARDIAAETNAEMLRRTAGVPIVSGLTGEVSELSADWRRVLDL